MKNTFLKGLLTALAFYVAGFLIYYLVEHTSELHAHGWGFHHFVAILLLVTVFIRLIVTLLFRPFRTKTYYLSVIFVDFLAIGTTVIWLMIAIRTGSSDEASKQGTSSTITLSIDSANESSTIVARSGDSLFLDNT